MQINWLRAIVMLLSSCSLCFLVEIPGDATFRFVCSAMFGFIYGIVFQAFFPIYNT
jgi:lipopolysaccharide export LptBFGC system permease protein LptF